jgi:Leucine-rich repeat (LRR) protein
MDITKLVTLDILYLNSNNFFDLPYGISQLTALKALSLDYNHLRQFPKQVMTLHNLEQLYLEHNEMSHIPRNFLAPLTNLQMLYLGHNKLTELPPNIASLTSLKRLYLNNNLLCSLPTTIGALHNLEILKLENNDLKTLPITCVDLTKLRIISLKNNPWTIPQSALADVPSLFEYLNQESVKAEASPKRSSGNLPTPPPILPPLLRKISRDSGSRNRRAPSVEMQVSKRKKSSFTKPPTEIAFSKGVIPIQIQVRLLM